MTSRRPGTGFIHPSDSGVPYTSAEYVVRLEEIETRPSMSKTGCPYVYSKAS